MVDRPALPKTPLELLNSSSGRDPPYLSQIWGPLMGATVGFVGACVGNWSSRRPVFSGIQKHVFFTVAGGFLGQYIEDVRSQYYADKDAVLRHYVELHPEDFPPYERKKFKELFLPWVPIR